MGHEHSTHRWVIVIIPMNPFRNPIVALYMIAQRIAHLGHNVDRRNTWVVGEMESRGHGIMCVDVKFACDSVRGREEDFHCARDVCLGGKPETHCGPAYLYQVR